MFSLVNKGLSKGNNFQ